MVVVCEVERLWLRANKVKVRECGESSLLGFWGFYNHGYAVRIKCKIFINMKCNVFMYLFIENDVLFNVVEGCDLRTHPLWNNGLACDS